MTIRVLVINPNSTSAITDGLRDALEPYRAAHVQLDYFTGPARAPTGIRDFRTGVLTAAICFEELEKTGAFDEYDGFLVCCFTDHPLQHMIREQLGPTSPKPCIGMFEAGLSKALMLSRKIGVLSTGSGPKPLLSKGVMNFLGAASSDRWAGGVTSGIAIEELRDAAATDKVERLMKDTAARVAEEGADCIVMGCAGMAGMEPLVLAGVREVGLPDVRVVDAAVAGLVMLVGMVETDRPRQ
ncbi:Protein dcg1 [Rhodotorula kratochvilovae]